MPAAKILIVHDEIELPFGELRMKTGGGHKGHNGLRDIISRCGFADFHRLRFGVYRPGHPDVAAYVLADFSSSEKEELPAMIAEARDICLKWLRG